MKWTWQVVGQVMHMGQQVFMYVLSTWSFFILNQAYTQHREIVFRINITTGSSGCLWTLIKARLLILIMLHAETLMKLSKNGLLVANMTPVITMPTSHQC